MSCYNKSLSNFSMHYTSNKNNSLEFKSNKPEDARYGTKLQRNKFLKNKKNKLCKYELTRILKILVFFVKMKLLESASISLDMVKMKYPKSFVVQRRNEINEKKTSLLICSKLSILSKRNQQVKEMINAYRSMKNKIANPLGMFKI